MIRSGPWEKRWISFVVLCCMNLLPVQSVQAQTPVSVELVLAVDTSYSVNNGEFRLQMTGIADALRSPEIVKLIEVHEGVAMSVIQWAGWSVESNAIKWRLLTTPQSIYAFADEIETMRRDNVGNFTAIGTAIETSLHALAVNEYAGETMKIDISGDGISNVGPAPSQSRLLAEIQDVTINGLAIKTDQKNLDQYYRNHVISGRGAFVIEAADFEDFARAIRLKLLKELAPVIGSEKRAPAGKTAQENASRLATIQEPADVYFEETKRF